MHRKKNFMILRNIKLKSTIVNISRNVSIDFDKFGSLLCVGAIGTGKTYLLSFIVGSLYLNLNKDVEFYSIDPKGLELTSLMRYVGGTTAHSGKEIFTVLRSVRDEMMERYHLLSKKSIKDGFSCDFPPLFLVIDELIFIKNIVSEGHKTVQERNKAFRDVLDLLSQIAVLGRQCRVFCFIASQYLNTDYLPLSISENLLNRIFLGNPTSRDIIQVFGESFDVSSFEGYGLYKNPSLQEPKIFIPYQYDMRQMIEQIELENNK